MKLPLVSHTGDGSGETVRAHIGTFSLFVNVINTHSALAGSNNCSLCDKYS